MILLVKIFSDDMNSILFCSKCIHASITFNFKPYMVKILKDGTYVSGSKDASGER